VIKASQTHNATAVNRLYHGDNLEVLREQIANESVDLVYLDPPFNSKRDYNLLFKLPEGRTSEAQIEAFEDTWHWTDQTEREFGELLHQPNTDLADMMRALRSFLGENGARSGDARRASISVVGGFARGGAAFPRKDAGCRHWNRWNQALPRSRSQDCAEDNRQGERRR
jgi:hypothetical protein